MLFLALAGAAMAAPPANAKATAATAPGRTLSDAEIERSIKDRFSRSKIAREGFQVRVQGGVATIDGKTEVIQRKGTATRLAKLAGAKRVENRIQISEAARQRALQRLRGGDPVPAATEPRRAEVKR